MQNLYDLHVVTVDPAEVMYQAALDKCLASLMMV